MNVHILRNVMVVYMWNDQKVINYVHAKAQHEWDKLVIIATMSTITNTNFGQISFKAIITSVGS